MQEQFHFSPLTEIIVCGGGGGGEREQGRPKHTFLRFFHLTEYAKCEYCQSKSDKGSAH